MTELEPQTATEILESLKADAKLAHMEACDDLAKLCDKETTPRLRELFAQQYRCAIGVDPAQRDALRVGLKVIQQTGQPAVEQLITSLTEARPPPSRPTSDVRSPASY